MTVESEVLAVAAIRDEVLVGNDAELIASYMTDDWVYVTPEGPTPKADIIGWIASGRLVHHTMTAVSPERVVRVGDTVVVTAKMASSGSWDGEPYSVTEWISEIYVPVDGTWRCAFSQKTDVA